MEPLAGALDIPKKTSHKTLWLLVAAAIVVIGGCHLSDARQPQCRGRLQHASDYCDRVDPVSFGPDERAFGLRVFRCRSRVPSVYPAYTGGSAASNAVDREPTSLGGTVARGYAKVVERLLGSSGALHSRRPVRRSDWHLVAVPLARATADDRVRHVARRVFHLFDV